MPDESVVDWLVLLGGVEIEVVVEERNSQPRCYFSKGLAQADPLATKERVEHLGVALSAVRARHPGRFQVKSCGFKLVWLLPLVFAVVHRHKTDRESLILLELYATDRHRLVEARRLADSDGRLNAQRLVKTVPGVLEVLNDVWCQVVDDTGLGCSVNCVIGLVQEALFDLRVLRKLLNELSCRDLDSLHSR